LHSTPDILTLVADQNMTVINANRGFDGLESSQLIAASKLLESSLTTNQGSSRIASSNDRAQLSAVGDRRVETTQDFNNDGQADLLWRNYSTGAVGAWLMNGSTIQGWAAMPTAEDLNWRIEGTGDFNSDGQTDLLWRNYSTGAVGAWLMNGSTIQGWAAMQTVADLNWRIEGTGDFNSDGQTDLLWRNYSIGNVGAWLMNGSTIQSWAGMQTVADLNWRIEGTGDFNSDGQSDLVWRNYSTGAVGAWLMNGSTIQSWAGMQTVADLNWRIEGAGDFNGDNRTDLLWRNYSTGAVGAWLMNGSTIQSWSGMQTVADLNWQVVVSNGVRRSDLAGNTISTARNLGTIGAARTITDSIGGADSNDYYRFDLAGGSTFSLSLTGLADAYIFSSGLTGDVDVVLLDAQGNSIQSSSLSGTQSESIIRELNAGTYYVRVYPYVGSTNYALTLSAYVAIITPDGAGNTQATARNVGVLSGNRSFQDFVGGTDSNDYYRFELSQSSEFTLDLNGLSGDADVQLLDSSGDVITSSSRAGSTAESIVQQLTSGTYYIRVYPYVGSANYNLSLSAVSNGPADGAGNSLGAARNIGALSGSRAFQDYVGTIDTNDYYRFNLTQTSDFNLVLDGLSADADVELLNSSGQIIQGSYGAFAGSESVARRLNAGDYYIRIYPYSGNTNYNLRLSAIAASTVDGAGNTLAAARYIGALSGSRSFQDAVSSSDPNDYYRFDLAQNSNFSLSLNGLSSDADVELLNSSGQFIASSLASGLGAELITRTLNAGTYYIRVYPFRNSDTNYQLNLSATTIIAGFSSIYGYGLVNAAAAVARAIGQTTPFANVTDLGGDNWSNDMVNAPEVWASGYTGQGITVAVIDSGVDINHEDLANNIWRNSSEIAGNGIDDDRNGYIDDVYGWNFGANQNNNNVLPGTTSQGQGHGTHVAGTIAAANNGLGVTGVAYGSRIMALRLGNVANDGRFTNPGSLAEAIRYAVNNGARVINMSLGWSDSAELREALAYAASRNVITVSAAGNESEASPGNPAQYATQYGISVGAININRGIAGFSNRAGSNSIIQQVVGPGVDIYSTTPGNTYGYKSGTSMATPAVAGVIALMLSANPNLTHAQIRDILTSSAVRLS
jgi:trimeric autotransporter adhesin